MARIESAYIVFSLATWLEKERERELSSRCNCTGITTTTLMCVCMCVSRYSSMCARVYLWHCLPHATGRCSASLMILHAVRKVKWGKLAWKMNCHKSIVYLKPHPPFSLSLSLTPLRPSFTPLLSFPSLHPLFKLKFQLQEPLFNWNWATIIEMYLRLHQILFKPLTLRSLFAFLLILSSMQIICWFFLLSLFWADLC